MEVKKITAYHACKDSNGYQFIFENIPFLSGDGDNQWLTQGYYFWTDSDYWAKRWGKKGQRVIGKFAVDLCLQNEVLDLVGNVKHQMEFRKFADIISNHLPPRTVLSVNQVIAWLRRRPDVFPYKAIKAADEKREQTMKFVVSRGETMNVVSRQQLCVFEENRHRIELCGFTEPHNFSRKNPPEGE